MSIAIRGTIMPVARMAIATVAHAPRPLARQLMQQVLQLADRGRAFLARVTDTYRPEKHYMRGPGPKCRAKAIAQLRG